ncbi:mycothiol-dependent nitroreductase Rv2466c family protein [Streptomonospora litoralis]|uniref:DSBA-like thioredoxin domain protein n=1 Tax=Streptomonospora litoralis TaxID=2498135 RepID=A0A4P6QAU1_9ACTN|nr:DsbA family protein [Streptomonospora litoralis]QBI56614.1 DSBA-like thioredoxin domain protein [Streptomonospora litoralis]
MSDSRDGSDLELFFDPVCPFCWMTAQWVRNVARERPLNVAWRPLSLRILNEPIGYADRPAAYPDAHQRGLELLRVVVAAREQQGADVVGPLYAEMGEAVWNAPAPEEPTFEAVLASTAQPRDLSAILTRAGLPTELAAAAQDSGRDAELRAETEEAVRRAGGGVGTPVLSFEPPDGPAFFGPVIDEAPEGRAAVELWDAVATLARWRGFAELKRGLRSFPDTPLSARISRHGTQVG